MPTLVGTERSAEVKIEWSYAPSLPACLHGMQRDNFTFTFHQHHFDSDVRNKIHMHALKTRMKYSVEILIS